MSEHVPISPESPVERALVARGWADIDEVERMGSGATRRHRVATLRQDHARARAWYRSPVDDHVPAAAVAMYESEANVVRYRRVVDFLTEGEHVYEIGLGFGYLGTMMLREGRLGRYRGVDLVPGYVERTRTMLEANGLDGQGAVEQQDLYDVTRADLEELGTSLLVCCEVIEHVPDPEGALTVLARALPPGADLLFSIPLVGRLETIWGHGQVFGAARIRSMLAGAGLVAHHVEVLHDTWALVLASATPGPSPRAAAALEGIADVDDTQLLEPPFRTMANVAVTDLERVESRWTKRVGDVTVEPCATRPDATEPLMEGIRVTATAQRITRGPGKGWSASAGVAFAVPEGSTGVRLEVDVPDLAAAATISVEFRRDGERTGLWKWKPAERRPDAAYPTFLIAPGREGVSLRRVPGSVSTGADTVEVFVTAVDDEPIDVGILRWSWVS